MVTHPRPHWLEPLHVPDRVFFVISITIMMLTLVMLVWAWPLLPSPVPQHLNFAGQVDGYASKNLWNVFGTVVINMLIGLGIAFAYAHPEYTNLPTSLPWKNITGPKRGMVLMAVRHLLTMTFVWSTMLLSSVSLALVCAGLGVAVPSVTIIFVSVVGLSLITIGGYTLLLTKWLAQFEG